MRRGNHDRSKPGYVYAIGIDRTSWIKIGVSMDPATRLKDLQPLIPFDLIIRRQMWVDEPYLCERYLHDYFADYRKRAEWFYFPNDDWQAHFDEAKNMYWSLGDVLMKTFWSLVKKCGHGETCKRCCWAWQGHAIFSFRGIHYAPARMAIMSDRHSGILPILDMKLCRRCQNSNCCNPRHLFWVTARDYYDYRRNLTPEPPDAA